MRCLADTHILIWSFENSRRLSAAVTTVLRDRTNEVFFSPVSLWEIAIKYQLGKLTIHGVTPEEFLDELESSFFDCLPLDARIMASSHRLPRLHGDPFDRLLIWQAISTGCTLLSADRVTDQYAAQGLNLIH